MERSTTSSISGLADPVRHSERTRVFRSQASRLAITVVVALLASVTSAPARAASPTEDLLSDRFVTSLGGFLVTSTVDGSLSGSANTTGQSIDFDKQFGTDAEQTRWRAELLWRITPTQHVRFTYFDNKVDGTRSIDRDLPWGDYTFKAGGAVSAEANTHVYELDYEFAFLRRPNYQIVAVAGLHLDELTLKLSGNASLTVDTPTGPVEDTATFTRTSHSVSALQPVFGFRGDWAVSPHVYLDASAQIFSLSYQGISGNWSELRAGATWMFSSRFGVGIGYDRFSTHVDVGKANFNGRLNWGYQGLLLYLKAGF
jgi:hypothetical protein